MWRALFLALGAYACILGIECLVIDKAVLAAKDDGGTASRIAKGREIVPAEWAPWSLISIGAVTMLYTFTIPARVGAKK